VIDKQQIRLDERDSEAIVQQLLARRAGYVPQWLAPDNSAGVGLSWIFARYVHSILQRLNQTPEKNKLAFLDLLGLGLVPATSARVPVVFQLSEQASSGAAPAGTAVAAPAPPGSTDQIVFETEHSVGVMAGKLVQVFSLWPGRDEYIDHSAATLAGLPFQLFLRKDLQPTPHQIYLAHDTLLALSGTVELSVEFELTHPSAEPLEILWEYWDGQMWRSFLEAMTTCTLAQKALQDSTNGLTQSGRFLLMTDCAQASKTSVNGNDGYWIRGRLNEALPADPDNPLPEVETVRISSKVNQPLKASLSASAPYQKSDLTILGGIVRNDAGEPIVGATVVVTNLDDLSRYSTLTYKDGIYAFSPGPPLGKTYRFELLFQDLAASTTPTRQPSPNAPLVDLTFVVDGVKPDKAFADGTALDVTKPFYPLGMQPQPGSTFYFTSQEIFSKPNAQFRTWMARTNSPQDQASITTLDSNNQASDAVKLPHLLTWEYWNGEQWVVLAQSSSDPASMDLNVTEIVDLTVPIDMAPTKVNQQEALWMRVRLISGSFGFLQEVSWTDFEREITNTFRYVIPQPPALAMFRMGYTWEHGPFFADQVITYNDFRYTDYTYKARWPGKTFAPFERLRDLTPSLYLGFDKQPPVDQIGLYFDIVEDQSGPQGPALVWEYWDGFAWRPLSAEDETQRLRLPGIASFIAAEDSKLLARFGTSLHWVRARLKEDGSPGEPVVNGIFPNAVWASQIKTLTDVPLGASSGMPNQVMLITQTPVLDQEQIEVRELAGARANVEWRILALEISGGDRTIIRDFETLLGQEGPQTDFVIGDLRLRRDRSKKVAEAWVRWYGHPNFFVSGKDDRHYVVDRPRGLVLFGDGINGKIPPAGSAVLAKRLRIGGGKAGNVAVRKVSQLLGVVVGVQSVFNPRAAEGGADGEALEQFTSRGPQTVRHRGRAISPADYETLAREASAAVAVARALPTHNPSGRPLPGWITLIIIPHSLEARPWPSYGLRQEVETFLAKRAPADLVAGGHIFVTGPEYVPIDVAATLAPIDPDKAGNVEKSVREALQQFLHPLYGGPSGRGWDAGRDVFLSDVAAVIERTKGVDYVEELTLLLNSEAQGERVSVPDEKVVVVGTIELKLRIAER
jgi:Baseplate J-like protein